MIFKNMTAKQIATSKAMIGGIGLIVVGVYIVSKGDYALGAGQITMGLGIMGIRDAQK